MNKMNILIFISWLICFALFLNYYSSQQKEDTTRLFQNNCLTDYYFHNEYYTGHRCYTDCDCDQKRTCSEWYSRTGVCQGTQSPRYERSDNCYSIDYYFKEKDSCHNDCQCDKNRLCKYNKCVNQGEDPFTDCINPNYFFDEYPYGHKCETTCQCDGIRTCSENKWCQGKDEARRKAGEDVVQDCENQYYFFDEYPQGHQCSNTCECDGTRTCSQYNWCQGNFAPRRRSDLI